MLELQVQRHNHCTGCDGVEGSSRGLEEGDTEAIQVHSQIKYQPLTWTADSISFPSVRDPLWNQVPVMKSCAYYI